MLRQALSIIAALGLWLALTGAAAAQSCSAYPFTFSPNTTIRAAQVNSDFASILTCANSNLAPLASPSFTGTVSLANPLAIGSGGTGASTLAGASIVTGPASATAASNVATFADTTGKVLLDSGSPLPIWTTGDAKLTLKTSADTGWILLNDGSIGDASSGGTTRANADTSALYTLVWTNCANAQCPVATGRGGTAAADFSAHKAITLPLTLGRALAVSGSGSGLTARALGATTGAETHSISVAEMPAHAHPGSSFGATNSVSALRQDSGGASTGFAEVTLSSGASDASYTPTGSVSVASQGSGTAMSLMQPTGFAFNVMVKL